MNAIEAMKRVQGWIDSGKTVFLLRVGCEREERHSVKSCAVFQGKSGAWHAHANTRSSVFCYNDDDEAVSGKTVLAVSVVAGSGNRFTDVYSCEEV